MARDDPVSLIAKDGTRKRKHRPIYLIDIRCKLLEPLVVANQGLSDKQFIFRKGKSTVQKTEHYDSERLLALVRSGER